MNRYIWLAYFTLFLSGIFDNARGPLYPQIISFFGLNFKEAALIFSLASMSGFFVLLFSMRWLKKWGVVRSNFVFILMITFSALGAGLCISFSWPYYLFLLFLFIYGAGAGGSTVTLNLLVSNGGDESRRRGLLSGLHSMYGIASLIIPMIISFLLYNTVPWSFVFYLIFVLGLILILIFHNVPIFEHLKFGESNQKFPTLILIKWGSCLALYVSCEILLSSRMVVYLLEHKQISQISANNYLTLFFLFLLLAPLSYLKVVIFLTLDYLPQEH